MADLPQLQYAKDLDDIEGEITAIKVLYDQYFLGLERHEPGKRRDELRKRLLRIKEVFMKNTGLRFRMQTLQQKFLSYERLWLRTLKEIEEGTYKRDLFKAKLHAKRKGLEKAGEAGAANGENGPAEAPAAAGTPQEDLALRVAVAAAGKKRPAAPSGPSMSQDKVQAIYDAYVMAKQRCNEPTEGLTPETLATTLRKQLPSLMQKHNAKDIDFKVVIKGGKALLKAVPKA